MRETLKIVLLATVLCALYGEAGASAESKLCPPLPSLALGQDDSRIKEEDFTVEQFTSSLSILETDIPKELQEQDTKKVLARLDSSEFWIGYANSLKFLRGYMLKQAALLQTGHSGISKKQQKKDAVKRFCDFITSAQYTD